MINKKKVWLNFFFFVVGFGIIILSFCCCSLHAPNLHQAVRRFFLKQFVPPWSFCCREGGGFFLAPLLT